MKKGFIFLISAFVIGASISGCGNSGKEKQEQQDAIRQADSIASAKAAEAAVELAKQETIRQDSIQKATEDSVKKAESMKITSMKFIENKNWVKTLPKFGFKLQKKSTKTEYEYDDLPPQKLISYVYVRDIDGKKIKVEFTHYADSAGEYEASMTIYDENERKEFENFLKSLGKSDGDALYFNDKTFHWIYKRGNSIEFYGEH